MAQITGHQGTFVSRADAIVCEFCGDPLEAGHWGTFRYVGGWEKSREAGGTNALSLREPQDRYACAACIDALRNGRLPGSSQGTLL